MGKRKQKVRWSSVEGISWSCSEQASSSPEGSAGAVKGSGSGGGTRRSSAAAWTNSLALRFERKAAEEAEQKHIYYEGEFCQAEDGFTKIRSKNLDILFKRDYYEQRIATQQQITEELMKLKEKNLQEKGFESLDKNPDINVENLNNHEEIGDLDILDETPKRFFSSFDQMDPNDIPEFKPINVQVDTPSCDMDSGQSSPIYINHLPHDFPASHNYDAPLRPNLYLYSPSDNSLIPCEEIIIPNPVMSPEGPVYPGPTNIYLAYPVQGPDGKGYITQPFATPGSAGSYLSQDSASYSPSISYDGSNYYPSTPLDSGSNTQPSSPPPLASYHPTKWINQDHRPSPIPQGRERSYKHTDGYYDPQSMDRSTDKHCHLNYPFSMTKTTPDVTGETVSFIPGLPQTSSGTSPKKSQKRHKKKTKPQNFLEHHGSASSESETQKPSSSEMCNRNVGNDHEVRSLQMSREAVPMIPVEPTIEIHLTDALADSLVNPPTDPEDSDEEVLSTLPVSSNINDYEDKKKTEDKAVFINTETNSFVTKVEFDNNEAEDKKVFINNENTSMTTEVDIVNDPTLDFVMANEDEHDSEIAKIEYKNNTIETLSAEEIACTVDPTESKCLPKDEQESNIANYNIEDLEHKNVIGMGRKIKSKNNKNKKNKKRKKLLLKPECDTKNEISSVNNNLDHQNSNPRTDETKKTYSSVIKSSLVTESIPSIQAIPSPIPYNPTCQTVQSNTEQDSDNWQKAPLADSKHENWEKTSRKRKHRNKIQFEDSPHTEKIPDLEIVCRLEESLKPQEVTKVLEEETVQEEENENAEQEKKKLRRKKKKHGSEGTEESNAAHRVIIRDDQIQIQPPGPGKRPSEVFSSALLDTVRKSSQSDFMVVSELGSGISRGCMNYGRLYQGKYIPPERTDGLIPKVESVNEEATLEEVICENVSSTTSEDIDLD